MFKLIVAIILLAVVIYTMVKYVRTDSERLEDIEGPQNETETPEFQSLNETVQLPPQGEVEKTKLYFNLNGVPYEVFTSPNGSKYILRKRVRDGSTYKDYLSEEEKKLCY